MWYNDSIVSYRTIFCLACAVILGTQGQDWNQGKAGKCWKVFFTIKTTRRWTLPPFMCELAHLPFVPLYILVIGFAYREAPCVGVRSLWLSFSFPWEASKQFHCRRRDVSISWLDVQQVVAVVHQIGCEACLKATVVNYHMVHPYAIPLAWARNCQDLET